MVEKDWEVSGQQTHNEVTDYINMYELLTGLSVSNITQLKEYASPKLTPTWFTYHRKKDKTGKYIDDGKCRICGKDRQYLLIRSGIPPICERCYQSVRGYNNLLFDPLKVKSKRDLNISDCKKIVDYMTKYAKKKLLALAALGTYYIAGKK